MIFYMAVLLVYRKSLYGRFSQLVKAVQIYKLTYVFYLLTIIVKSLSYLNQKQRFIMEKMD